MTPTVRKIAIRLASALGFTVDEKWFNEADGWALVAKVETMMGSNARLPPQALRLFEELAINFSVHTGDEKFFCDALEAQLGPSPFPPETIVAVVKFVRSQLHFPTAQKPVELAPKPTASVPLKNYDYE